MSYSGCEEFLGWFSQRQENDPVFRERMMQAIADEDTALEAVATAVRLTDPAFAATAEMEIRELPEIAVRTMLSAWRDAVEGGLDFRARSVPPERPMEFARKRRVRVTVDRDEGRVDVALSHIPTRHPARR